MPSDRVDRADHGPREPVGNLPKWDRALLKDYERDASRPPPPAIASWNGRELSPGEQATFAEALLQARDREASVVSMGRR
jgi:hypothetical protein